MVITGLESVEELLGIEYKLLSTVRPSVFINSSVAVLLISMLACVYPAYRVWRLEPLKGLRFT
jgi:ABC-type lipoprotein release transport system permease subunit